MTQKLYCNANCMDGWKTDRRYGIIYPPCLIEKTTKIPKRFREYLSDHNEQYYVCSWKVACQIVKRCLYCNSPL